MKLRELATMVRSKNAGPLLITFDVMLPDATTYTRTLASGALDEAAIGKLYDVDPASIRRIGQPGTNTIKITLPRWVTAGDPGDTDLYGAQQYAPLLDVEVPD